MSEKYNLKKYSWLSNIIFNIKAAEIWDKKLFRYQFLTVLPNVAGTYLGFLLPSELLRGLEYQWPVTKLMLSTFVIASGLCLLKLLDKGMMEYIYRVSPRLTLYYEKCCYRKIMRLNYDMLEEPECSKLIGNTWNVLRNEYATRESVSAVPQILCGMAGVFWYGIMIALKSRVIILLAAANTFLSIFLMLKIRKKHAQIHQKIGSYTKETAYISKQSMDKAAGKDIRIYQMTDWFLKKYDSSLSGMDGLFKQIHDKYFCLSVSDALMTFFLNLFSYLYLIELLMKEEITASLFVLYIGLIGSFSAYFGQLMDRLAALNPIGISLNYIRNFLDLEEDPDWGKGIGAEKIAEMKKAGVQIELKGVSYSYPDKQQETLSDINLIISPGEKLALIGLNGAGKTTLVKLLCGFYRPTKGEILINKIPVSDFSREEYYELMSVLFQDATLLPMALDHNLTGEIPKEIDREHLNWALAMSGFEEKYNKLAEGGETLLVREVNEEALDFSGGEKQKLLFARALYKKTPLMILDEPTAALDPIAENETYMKLGEAAKNRTCVYISHRLSSTRFCDRIILMEHGRITEEGTHEELMAKGMRYAQLFELQSRYYKEQAKRRKRSTDLDDMFTEQDSEEGIFYE